MLFLFTTLLFILAGVSLAILIRKLVKPVLLEQGDRRRNLAAATYRPLFEPTDDDLRRLEADEIKQLAANTAEEKRLELKERIAKLETFRRNWFGSPNRAATIELLYRASQTSDGNAYHDVCESVMAAWRGGKLADISANDLAQLLETHFWLLPADQRTPGVSFRLMQETAGLRRDSSKDDQIRVS